MYITVFELNYKDKRTATSITNRHELHRDVQALFENSRAEAKSVYRVVERLGKVLIYIYSEKPVNKEKAHFGMKLIGEAVAPDFNKSDHLYIDMLVTPIKTMYCDHDGKKRKRPIFDSEERLEWCRRTASRNGFKIHNISEVKKETLKIDKHHNTEPWIVDAYEYKFDAVIENADKFRECLINGFGRNGSYGAGLLIIGGKA